MQSPKSRYQMSSQDVEWHKALVGSAVFERAADAAMLEVANNSSEAINGAKEFLRAFTSLSNMTVKSPIVPTTDLDYTKH